MSSTGNDIVALHAINKERTNQIQFFCKILSVSEQALYAQPEWSAMPFEHFVWLLWSVKESAYKYLQRIQPDLVFAPVKIVIQRIDVALEEWPTFERGPIGQTGETGEGGEFGAIIETGEIGGIGSSGKSYKGIVLFESGIYYFRSIIDEAFIASVISDQEGFEHTWWGVQSIGHTGYDQQSSAVRDLVLQKLSAVYPLNLQMGHSFQGSGEHVRNGDHVSIGKSPLGYPVVLNGEEEMDIPVSLAHHDRYVAYSFHLPRL